MAKDKINKKEIDRLWRMFRRQDLMDDRSEYDEADLMAAYPQLNKAEAHYLYVKLQRWRYGKTWREK
jgi:hypothetical protein